MPYYPKEPPGIDDIDSALQWVQGELRSISAQFNEQIAVDLRLVGQEPLRPREGMIVAADGTNWNPGGGKGIYAYLGTVWVKLS